MSDDIMQTHGAKEITTSTREEQRYMRDSLTCGMSESRPVFPSNYKSHDRALTVGTTLPAATIHGWLSGAPARTGDGLDRTAYRSCRPCRLSPKIAWRFRTCASTNRERSRYNFDAAGRPRIAVSLRTQLEAIYSPDTMEEPRRLRCAVEERLLAVQINTSRLESI